ncbi:biotin-dependent carboxyltransferase family protein [Desulfofundulus salinus]|uniref:Biotin-dependent carboxyltransferase n=1 Tax=Desulfofundulus salinus TaxID=2419843 RepID=A0A494WZ03_9FIRM|nr:biotin-dependent carboxyltransferase family protein [Desulfofundulus salinum]RKO65860.1 biotin-dependent carboxyltransferase [Desulfofundulus salinum]
MAVLKVEKPGMLTTIQDLGRHGFQEFGMPVAGAADEFSFKLANMLVRNRPEEAALELTLAGPTLKVLEEGVIAITGADMGPQLNGRPLVMWEAVLVYPGDVLSFGWSRQGCRAYLAVAGGINVPPVMGSKSTYLRGSIGGFEGRALRGGDIISSGVPSYPLDELVGRSIPPEYISSYNGKWEVRVVLGPQDDYFTAKGIQTFLQSEYKVTPECDRMGCRLEGPPIEHQKGADIISDGIPAGAVQVPGHGQPIIMLADRQTTGGYAKIATVISSDLWKVAQAKPGDIIHFRAVTLPEAHQAYRIYRERLQSLPTVIQILWNRKKHYRIQVNGKIYRVCVEKMEY